MLWKYLSDWQPWQRGHSQLNESGATYHFNCLVDCNNPVVIIPSDLHHLSPPHSLSPSFSPLWPLYYYISFFFTLHAANLGSHFMEDGQIIASTDNPDDYESLNNPTYNQIIIDITTSFTVLVGIFFPSCTGMYSSQYFGCNLFLGDDSFWYWMNSAGFL